MHRRQFACTCDMTFLTPLYIAGLLAVGFPLLWHLIRRTPQGQVPFSSLMFLSPSPPRITRRSRLEHLLLLILRATVLVLLALAFARPFFRMLAPYSASSLGGRHVAILLDTSASMQRGDVWNQALQSIETELQNLGPNDRVALYTFEDQLQARVPFPAESAGSADLGRQVAEIRAVIRGLTPSWGGTELGQAVVLVAETLRDITQRQKLSGRQQILLVSDMQRGARLDALQAYVWPESVQLAVRSVKAGRSFNARAHMLVDEEGQTDWDELRIRVDNAADSDDQQLQLQWFAAGQRMVDQPVFVSVPPGQSRVVRMPAPESRAQADSIVLSGDAHGFDNVLYVAFPERDQLNVALHSRARKDDPQGIHYYLQLALALDRRRQVSVKSLDESFPAPSSQPPTRLAIIDAAVSADQGGQLRQLLEQGGTVFVLATSASVADTMAHILQRPQIDCELVQPDDYVMLGQIDFQHPLFQPFADPRYNDFTKIHFWRYFRFSSWGDDAHHLVAFENDDPALVQWKIGSGSLLLMTSSWQPADSQLARSSKFVPLLHGILDQCTDPLPPAAGVRVHQALPGFASIYRDPQGNSLSAASDRRSETPVASHPGIYTALREDKPPVRVAVNLAETESRTEPWEVDALEQFGVVLGATVPYQQQLDEQRHKRDTELESQQKVWRWLLLAALVVLVCETLLAGRYARKTAQTE